MCCEVILHLLFSVTTVFYQHQLSILRPHLLQFCWVYWTLLQLMLGYRSAELSHAVLASQTHKCVRCALEEFLTHKVWVRESESEAKLQPLEKVLFAVQVRARRQTWSHQHVATGWVERKEPEVVLHHSECHQVDLWFLNCLQARYWTWRWSWLAYLWLRV